MAGTARGGAIYLRKRPLRHLPHLIGKYPDAKPTLQDIVTPRENMRTYRKSTTRRSVRRLARWNLTFLGWEGNAWIIWFSIFCQSWSLASWPLATRSGSHGTCFRETRELQQC